MIRNPKNPPAPLISSSFSYTYFLVIQPMQVQTMQFWQIIKMHKTALLRHWICTWYFHLQVWSCWRWGRWHSSPVIMLTSNQHSVAQCKFLVWRAPLSSTHTHTHTATGSDNMPQVHAYVTHTFAQQQNNNDYHHIYRRWWCTSPRTKSMFQTQKRFASPKLMDKNVFLSQADRKAQVSKSWTYWKNVTYFLQHKITAKLPQQLSSMYRNNKSKYIYQY